MTTVKGELIEIPVDKDIRLEGNLFVPDHANGLVVFSHGSGSSRKSPRNNFVAEEIRKEGPGTLLFDLLTEAEDRDRENRFDIPLLVDRLTSVIGWLMQREETKDLDYGLFGSSTGAASALLAAADLETDVGAVVSRGGRVDLAEDRISKVLAPTLFIVGGDDTQVLQLNREAFEKLQSEEKSLEVIEGAGHLFEGPGELDEVAELAADWFGRHLSP